MEEGLFIVNSYYFSLFLVGMVYGMIISSLTAGIFFFAFKVIKEKENKRSKLGTGFLYLFLKMTCL